jgi:hypothetical protein
MREPNKRVAVLSPIAWRTPPRQYGAWETVASNITEGLADRGWDVTLVRQQRFCDPRSPASGGGQGI